MKNVCGNYFRMTSADGFDNLGLKVKFDIIIVFKESFELSEDIYESLDLMIEGGLRGLAMEQPYAKKAEVVKRINMVLEAMGYLEEVANIFSEQSVYNF